MKKINWNKDWTFMFGEPSNIPMIPQKTKQVDLPYDFIIEHDSTQNHSGAEVGFYPGKTGSYTKYIEVAENDNKQYILYIDGCFGNSKVVVNGNLVLRHHYGYTPFYINVSDYLHVGSNRVTITASNEAYPCSRWYSGAGLYRNVYLLTSGEVFIVPDGIYSYVESVDENKAVVVVRTTIKNNSLEKALVNTTSSISLKANPFFNPNDEGSNVVLNSSSSQVEINAGEEAIVEARLIVNNPKLWDIDTPYLYNVNVALDNDDASTTIGIRTITQDATNGLRLNGKTIKLKGGCIHHDNGVVGSAAYKDAEYRKVLLHKNAGFNALRFSHNPVSEDMLNACDEIGLLVINEAFDTFEISKNYNDFANFFEYEWEKEITAFVVRDRNHPCIFMWSIGNEIPEQTGISNGYKYARLLSSKVRELDSTRAVGGALCSFFTGLNDEDNARFWQDIMKNAAQLKKNGAVNLDSDFGREIWRTKTLGMAENYDIVGYNYLNYQFEPTHKMYPERVMCTTESKPLEFFRYWNDTLRLPYVIGDFEWTSMDYIGEAGIGNVIYVTKEQEQMARMGMNYARYPMRLAGCGNFDICGFVKPQLAYKQIVWGSTQTYLVTHNPSNFNLVEIVGRYGWPDCAHSYSWPVDEGCPIKIEVYSRAHRVDLYLNDALIESKNTIIEDEYKTTFVTEYKKGTLTAISYDENGNEVSKDTLVSYDEFDHFVVRQNETNKKVQETLNETGARLYYYEILSADKNDNILEYGEYKINVEVTGNAKLLGLGTGRLATEENYTSGAITTYKGKAMAIILSEDDSFELNVNKH